MDQNAADRNTDRQIGQWMDGWMVGWMGVCAIHTQVSTISEDCCKDK